MNKNGIALISKQQRGLPIDHKHISAHKMRAILTSLKSLSVKSHIQTFYVDGTAFTEYARDTG